MAGALTGKVRRVGRCGGRMCRDVRLVVGGVVAEPVRVRRLTDQEGRRLPQIVRRGGTSSVRYRRAMVLLTSVGKTASR